jgi:hypothetical protein
MVTWYAHEVIAPGSQKVARVFASDPMLAPFSYRLHGPLEHAWHRPEVAHGFPETGLIVVRPVCGLADDVAEWYGEPVLDWGSLRATDTSSPLDPAAVAQACGVNNAFLPPESFLSFLQALATRAEATLLFYSCSTWGGDIESEYAFVLGRSPSAIVALPQDGDGDGCPRVVVIDGARQTPATRDVLSIALSALDFQIPTPFFAPHTRAFPWQSYRLGREPA